MEPQAERNYSVTKSLYEAAIKGDVPSLLNLIREDPIILDQCIIEKSSRFSQSPLHVAANLGHLEFTIEILRQKPELAEELDQSNRLSPLHMASAKGHLEIVNALLAVNPNMCFARDIEGRNPVHVAAINGQIKALEVLLQAKPLAARERAAERETILHLCVKHGQLETLKFLIQFIGDGQLLNFKDSDGNTVLHLAVATKHYETIKFLLNDKRLEKNAININGLTAMDAIIQTKKDLTDGKIWSTLRRAKVLKAKHLLKPKRNNRGWLERQSTALMVVSSLIATMAFQAGINPPGGVWQDDSDGHKPGTSIMAHVNGGLGNEAYNSFLVSNTIGLISSLTVIILLISGLPCQKLFIGILMVTMWIAVSATTVTYIVSVHFLVFSEEDLFSHKKELIFPKNFVLKMIIYVCGAWVILLGVLISGHVLRLIFKMIKQLFRLVIKIVRSCHPRARNFLPT